MQPSYGSSSPPKQSITLLTPASHLLQQAELSHLSLGGATGLPAVGRLQETQLCCERKTLRDLFQVEKKKKIRQHCLSLKRLNNLLVYVLIIL